MMNRRERGWRESAATTSQAYGRGEAPPCRLQGQPRAGSRCCAAVLQLLALLGAGCGVAPEKSSAPSAATAAARTDDCLDILIASTERDARFVEPIVVEEDRPIYIDPKPVVTCRSMLSATLEPQISASGHRVLRVKLDAMGAEAMRAATAQPYGRYLVFRWGGEFISTPRIMAPLGGDIPLVDIPLRHEDQALLQEIAARIAVQRPSAGR
jgi:hypothetical protein